MPSKNALKTHSVTYIELVKAAHTNPSAARAVDEYDALVRAGVREPMIRYSKFNGYQVRDPNEMPPRFPS